MQPKMPGLVEFVALVALLSSLMALAIDAMLPALPVIGTDLGVSNPNSPQLIISTVFLGMLVGQVLFGPISDSIGRKPLIYWGLGLFMVGSLVSMFAHSFEMMLFGRILQGIGVAAPRVVTMALVRDCYSGREMAQIMSFTMIVFIMVPAIAPSLGQGIIWIADWRMIFGAFILLSAPMLIWFWLRMPETWPAAKRRPFAWHEQWEATKIVCSNRLVMGYSLVTGLVFAAFLGYLNSVQQILQEQYGLGAQFPLYFAALALSIGGASIVNAKLVMKLGMRLLSARALQVVSVTILVSSRFENIGKLMKKPTFLQTNIDEEQRRREEFRELYDSFMRYNDEFFLLEDFGAYVAAQEQIDRLYKDKARWRKMCIENIAHSGEFSSDNTIWEYAVGIWQVKPVIF